MISITNKPEVFLKELVIKTVFFSSPEEINLEEFINDFIDICAKYKLTFEEICEIFERIALFYPENNPFI